MAGRGFLKSRLAQLNKKANKSEEPEEPKSQVPVTRTPQEDNIQKVTPIISTEAIIPKSQQVVRGRRVIIFVFHISKTFYYKIDFIIFYNKCYN